MGRKLGVMMKKSLFLICFVLLGFLAFSQNMSVESFRCLDNDLSARVAKVKDINGELCALIRLNTPERGFEFSGCNVEKTEQKTGEIWVFVSPGVKFITIKHRDFGAIINYPFPESIKSGYAYEMKLRTARIKQIIEESITEQYLIIESNTPDAKIFINNEFVDRNSATKLLSLFEEHSYRVEAPLYHTKEGKIKLDENQKSTLQIDLDPAFGYLKVNTSPVEGAEIEINGRLQEGKTPFFSQELASGIYKVQAFMPMYTSQPLEVSVRDSDTTEITINLVSTGASVEISCQDKDVEIYIDGSYRCKGVFSASLGEGLHRLELKKDRHRSFRKNFTVKSSQPYKENLPALEPITGKLNLNSTPYGAKIFIDDKSYGETPILIPEILVGKHELRLEKSGFQTLYEQINIEEGKIAKYDLVLKEKAVEEKVKQESKPIKETPQPAPEEEKEEKEQKPHRPTEWKFSLGGGYVLDNGAKDDFSGTGINLGMKLKCNPGALAGFGFFASADMLYLNSNQNAKTYYQSLADEFVTNDYYDYYKITLPHYYDFPILLGVNYDLKLSKQFRITAQAGAGLNIYHATSEKHKYTIDGNTSSKIVTNPINTGTALQFGLGVELFKFLNLGADYYHFSKPNASKLIIKLSFNL